MIRWLVQSASDDPELAEGRPPAGCLSGWEEARMAGLRSDRRRRDWLLGRWTAKRMLHAALAEEMGVDVPLSAIIVSSDPDGAPRVMLPAVPFQGISLSISHRDARAFCAMSPLAPKRRDSGRSTGCVQVGADIELVEPRSPGFVEQYFTDEEIERVRSAPACAYNLLVTAIWSAKEAVLKALRLGLTVDTRSVIVGVDLPYECAGVADPPHALAVSASFWRPFSIRYEPGASDPKPASAGCDSWIGYWRTMQDAVLTLAVLNDTWVPPAGNVNEARRRASTAT